jgi:hypothetical protein
MWQKLDSMCGALEWNKFDSACQLAWFLLCPQSVETARVVGWLLSTSLGTCELYDVIRTGPATGTQANNKVARWFGGRIDTSWVIKERLIQVIADRTNGILPFPTCVSSAIHTYMALATSK